MLLSGTLRRTLFVLLELCERPLHGVIRRERLCFFPLCYWRQSHTIPYTYRYLIGMHRWSPHCQIGT